ncbi:hypothetical protein COM59_32120, partial [Bacillus pseudomycoides]
MSLETIDQQLCKEEFSDLTKEQLDEMIKRMDHTPVQEVMISDFYEENNEEVENNEMLELLHFMQQNGVPLKSEQVQAMFLMQEMGVGDIAKFMVDMKPKVTPFQRFFELINKITLADRIKG